MTSPSGQSSRLRGTSAVQLGVLDHLLGFRIRRIQNHLSRGFVDQMGPDGMRPGAFSALALIAANPGISQIALSVEVGFDKATVVAILDELGSRGLARRERDTEDRRRHNLFVTDFGKTTLERMAQEARTNELAVHAALTDDESRELSRLLDKVYDHAFCR